MDIASLQIKVNSGEVKTGDAALDKLTNTAKKAETATGQLNRTFAANGNAVKGFAGVINGALVAAFSRLLQVYTLIEGIRMADKFVELQGRVKLATQSVDEAAEAWRGLLDISQKTGSSVEAGVSVFQRLSFVRKEINATTQEMLQFTDTVTKLGTISGASGDALKHGLTQLGQSLSSSIVRAEEFNSIMENIPAVGVAIAKELGVSTGELRQLVINGKVLSEDVFSAMLNASQKTNEQFEKMPMTVSRAFGMFKANLFEFVGTLNESTSATEYLAKTIEFGSNRLKEMSVTVRIISTSFKAIGLAAKQAFNDALVEFQNMYNKVAVAIDKLTRGKIRPELMTSVYKINYEGQIANLPTQEEIMKEAFPERQTVKQGATRKIETDYKGMVAGLSASEEEKKAAEAIKKTIEGLKFKNEQMKRTNEEQELYNELRAANVEIDSAAGQQIQELVRQHQALQREQKATTALIDTMESGFKTLWKDAITGAGSWRDAMRSIVNDVSDMFYDLVVKDQLKGLLSGVLGGGGSGGGNLLGSLLGSVGGGISSAAGSFFGGVKSLFGFANGGEFQVGGFGGTDSQLVAFRASPDETVSIRRPGQGSGGVGSVIYNIDARGADNGVEERLKMALTQLDRSVERRALNAVQNQLQRDPTYGRRG